MAENGETLWHDVITYLESFGVKGCVIAGGCIRDFWLGLAPKDIDVFVPEGEHGVAGIPGWQVEDYDTQEHEEYEQWSAGQLAWLGNFTYEGFWINVIGRRDLRESFDTVQTLVNAFDMDVVKAYYVKGVGQGFTDAFHRDIAEKTATVCSEEQAFRAGQRFERFNERNPDVLTFVNPFGVTGDVFGD